MIKKSDSIYVSGHTGLVGSAIVRGLVNRGYENINTAIHDEIDLTDKKMTDYLFDAFKPKVVFMSAAVVGGIQANIDDPVKFFEHNLLMQCHVLNSAARVGCELFVMISSGSIYPAVCPQPMKEEYLLTGPVEITNEGYSLAKICGVKLAQYYSKKTGMRVLCPVPCNIYGPGDHYEGVKAHVLAALVKRFADAASQCKTEITLWGTGNAKREMLHSDDLADGIFMLIDKHETNEIINIGFDSEISISELSMVIAKHTGFTGRILWDITKPEGMARKFLDSTKIKAYGYKPKISLDEGVAEMVKIYRTKK